jgi:hypothetical protein
LRGKFDGGQWETWFAGQPVRLIVLVKFAWLRRISRRQVLSASFSMIDALLHSKSHVRNFIKTLINRLSMPMEMSWRAVHLAALSHTVPR